jgi:hypothetical protein
VQRPEVKTVDAFALTGPPAAGDDTLVSSSQSTSFGSEEVNMARWLVLLPVLAVGAGSVPAADLTKVDRAIAKEPAYRSKPKYCLLVFDPDAKFRVWLVLDGDVLYVDRNGNGDLTEADERLTGKSTPGDVRPAYPFAEIRQFPAIDSIPARGATKYTRLEVTHTTIKKDFQPTDRDGRELKARFAKDPALTRAGVTVRINDKVRVQAVSEWANSPAEAPICHIGGPLTMAPLHLQELQQGSDPTEVRFCLGSRGMRSGPVGAFAMMDYDEVPKEAQPVAEFRFTHKDPRRPPIVVKVKLDRC